MRYSLATFTLESNNGQQYPEIYSNHKQNAKELKIEKKNTANIGSTHSTPIWQAKRLMFWYVRALYYP